MIKELVLKNRSYRRFYQDKKVEREILVELINLTRFTASGMNKQPLRYIISTDEKLNYKINDTLVWAGYLKGWISPKEGELPSSYIVMIKDLSLGNSAVQDEGIQAQTILLGAVEKNLGGCMIANIKRKELSKVLNIDEEKYDIVMVIPIGYPKEEVVIEDINEDGDIKYYRDENQVHHVPKRKLEDIIL